MAEEPTGILKVTSSMPGAKVYVDGTEVGTTPLTRYVPAGSHQVRVVLDNFDPFVRKAEVQADATTKVDAMLNPGKGTVEFSVQAPGARVYVDDRDMGPSPIRLRDLKPGDHTWRVEAPKYEETSGSFTFQTGQNLLFNPTLQSSQGVFVVTSEPPGANVTLDGALVGTTPWRGANIPQGTHHVRVEAKGYATSLYKVDTSDGSRGEVKSRLSEKGGKLKIKTPSDTARVFINGDNFGTTDKLVLSDLDRGTYTVRVEQDGQKPAEHSVAVADRGHVVLRASLEPDSATTSSSLVEVKPLVQRWSFWAATGAVAAGGVTGGVLVALSLAPEPPPQGDIIVVLP